MGNVIFPSIPCLETHFFPQEEMIYSFPAPRSSGTDTVVVFDIFPRCMKLLSGGGRGPSVLL